MKERMIAQFVFDTLAFVKRLAAAGMDTRQAEALAEALTAHAFDLLATKADLRAAMQRAGTAPDDSDGRDQRGLDRAYCRHHRRAGSPSH